MATKTKGKLGLSSKDINTPILQGLEFLCQTFGYEMDAWERAAYERTLKDINGGVIAEAAQVLVDQAAAGRKFFPVPKAPDWKAECAKVIERRRNEAYRDSLPALCSTCGHEKSHTGARWKTVTVNGVERLTTCDCRTVALEAADRVGQPIALPPSREDQMELGS